MKRTFVLLTVLTLTAALTGCAARIGVETPAVNGTTSDGFRGNVSTTGDGRVNGTNSTLTTGSNTANTGTNGATRTTGTTGTTSNTGSRSTNSSSTGMARSNTVGTGMQGQP